MSKIRKDFETKLHNARCQAEDCAEENANLSKNRNQLLLQLTDEEASQKRAEQDAEKLRLTLRFERDLHRQEMKELCRQSKVNTHHQQIQISEKYKAQLNDSLNNLRGQLEEQLRLNHLNFNDQIKSLQVSGINIDKGGAAVAAISSVQVSLTATNGQITDLKSKLDDCVSTTSILETQANYWEKVLEGDKTQIDNLQNTINELCKKYQTLLDDKEKIQNELDAYNNMLKSEESRLNVKDICDFTPAAAQ